MDDFDKQIKEIKIARSAECFLEDIFQNLTITKHITNHKTFYKYDNFYLFEYDSYRNIFYYNKYKIHHMLKTKYKCDNIKICNLIKDFSNKYLNINDDNIFIIKDFDLVFHINSFKNE